MRAACGKCPQQGAVLACDQLRHGNVADRSVPPMRVVLAIGWGQSGAKCEHADGDR